MAIELDITYIQLKRKLPQTLIPVTPQPESKTEPEQPEHGAMSKPDHPSNASTELGAHYFNYIMAPWIWSQSIFWEQTRDFCFNCHNTNICIFIWSRCRYQQRERIGFCRMEAYSVRYQVCYYYKHYKGDDDTRTTS